MHAFALVGLALALSCAAPPRAAAQPIAADAAQPEHVELGPSSAALRGLPNAGAPLGPREVTLRTTAGYGITGSRRLVPSATHRLQGGVAVGISPMEWLGFGLRLDGRLELHGDDGAGAHISGFGDPRLFARAGHALTPEWSIGGELLAWLPGADAPSFVAAATSLDARVLGAYHPKHARFGLLASLGARLDNSASVAPPRNRMRASDIETLGVSDSNAALAAVGGVFQIDRSVQAFGELSADLLVGARAPRLAESPMRVTAGARWALKEGFQLEASAVIALSARPSLRPEAAWVPIEPRALLLLGVSYTWSLVQKKTIAPVLDVTNPYTGTGAEVPAPPDKQIATVQGQIVDDHGQPIPDVRVTLKTADGTQTELLTDAYGTYHFEGVPYGTVQLEARAVGFATQRWNATVNSPQIDAPEAKPLPPATNVGVLRGLIRSYRSTPLTAHVTITGAHGKVVEERDTTRDGRIELELPPGKYKVTIEARGYVRQTQSIRIHGNGVSVLNTDMRAQ